MHIPYQSALAYIGANLAGDTKYVYTQAQAQAQAQASLQANTSRIFRAPSQYVYDSYRIPLLILS